MLTVWTTSWCREAGKKKKGKRNSYLYDVAAKKNTHTLATKRHCSHYFDRSKHAPSAQLFQILQRPTHQSCTSRFLTEGNPDVMSNYSVKLRSSNARRLPVCLFQHSRWRNFLNHRVFGCTMRICLNLCCSRHAQEDADCTEGKSQHINIFRCIIRLSKGFKIKSEKNFPSYWSPQECFQLQSTKQKCYSFSEYKVELLEVL